MMVWMGHFIAYHTGSSSAEDNGLRAVSLQQLMHWPDTRWIPDARNPNFSGIYRLGFLKMTGITLFAAKPQAWRSTIIPAKPHRFCAVPTAVNRLEPIHPMAFSDEGEDASPRKPAPSKKAARQNRRRGKILLLSDSAFSSSEEARVRLEAPQQWAIESYGGVDVRLYRIPKPLEFCKTKNLHRLQTEVNYQGDGIANTLSYLWDSWYKDSRRLMQKYFPQARTAVINTTPQLGMGDALNKTPATPTKASLPRSPTYR